MSSRVFTTVGLGVAMVLATVTSPTANPAARTAHFRAASDFWQADRLCPTVQQPNHYLHLPLHGDWRNASHNVSCRRDIHKGSCLAERVLT